MKKPYPFENYKYYIVNKNGKPHKIIAASTYAGKTVRGVALCAPGDTFDLQKGKNIAAARCAIKVAQKRLERSIKKHNDAYDAWLKASAHLDKMCDYETDAQDALERAYDQLTFFLEEES